MAEARRAVEIGTAVGDASIRAMGRNAEARILIFQGHLEEGLVILDETAVAAVSGELDPMSTALLYCSTVCAFQGLAEYDRAEEWTTAGALEPASPGGHLPWNVSRSPRGDPPASGDVGRRGGRGCGGVGRTPRVFAERRGLADG
jgi:hypothetical protein